MGIAELTRNATNVLPAGELERKLALGRPLRVKLGIDPTGPDIHLGFAAVLSRLRAFQDEGHVAVLIVGDYTARVGDPSGRNALRPMLTKEQVDAYAQTYLDQVGKILLPERVEIRRNSEWLAPLSCMDVLKLMGRMTVSQIISEPMDTFSLFRGADREKRIRELMEGSLVEDRPRLVRVRFDPVDRDHLDTGASAGVLGREQADDRGGELAVLGQAASGDGAEVRPGQGRSPPGRARGRCERLRTCRHTT